MASNQTTPAVTSAPDVATLAASAPTLPKSPEKFLPAPRHASFGALVGIIIIIIVLIVGTLYFWGARLAERDAENAAKTPPAKSGINSDLEAGSGVTQ